MKRVTKADYLERAPEIESQADRLRTSSDPQLVARVTREYWFSVEYLAWIDGRWYGCVQYNNDDNEWETTDVGAYDEHQAYGILADAAREDRPQTMQFVPLSDSPLATAVDGPTPADRLASLLRDAGNVMCGEADELAAHRPHADSHLYHIEEGLRFHVQELETGREEVFES